MKTLIYVCLLLTMVGCMPDAEQVMPAVQYSQPILFHAPYHAVLYWQEGQQNASMQQPVTSASGGGIVGEILAATIDSQERAHNPGRYTFVYGKAQQAIFMTSLKDVLMQHQVFNSIDLSVNPSEANSHDVSITIYFKSTRVAAPEDGNIITLDVEMQIKAPNKPLFKRNYLVTSTPGGFFSNKDFKQHQTDVSQQLLAKLIAGMQQWYTQGK